MVFRIRVAGLAKFCSRRRTSHAGHWPPLLHGGRWTAVILVCCGETSSSVFQLAGRGELTDPMLDGRGSDVVSMYRYFSVVQALTPTNACIIVQPLTSWPPAHLSRRWGLRRPPVGSVAMALNGRKPCHVPRLVAMDSHQGKLDGDDQPRLIQSL